MPDISDTVVAEVKHEGEAMTTTDLVALIERQRENGRLVEDADQHRNAGVYRAADAAGLRDETTQK
ncbi:hypothetical protein ACOZ4N_18220 [Halorientalis pallida]|uniref:hypothetical protein n=1 Tax=Halorientalis pallida TaxID=2479928 RepID=UPI003C7025B5